MFSSHPNQKMRLEVYPTPAAALEAYKSFESYADGQTMFCFRPGSLVVENRYVWVRYIHMNESILRGHWVDKIRVHFTPSPEQELSLKNLINPNTTVKIAYEVVNV